jgi:hypothetical protein
MYSVICQFHAVIDRGFYFCHQMTRTTIATHDDIDVYAA